MLSEPDRGAARHISRSGKAELCPDTGGVSGQRCNDAGRLMDPVPVRGLLSAVLADMRGVDAVSAAAVTGTSGRDS